MAAPKAKSKPRAKGSGTIVKDRNRFSLRKMIDGKRASAVLRNPDGSYASTRKEAEKAAILLNKDTTELDTREKLLERVGTIRRLKSVAKCRLDDIWVLFLKSPNRPDSGEKQIREQQSMVHRFTQWLAKQGMSTNDISGQVAGEYMSELGRAISNRTFNRYLGMLKFVFSQVWKSVGLLENPFAGISRRTEESIPRREFTAEQVKAIFDGFETGFFYETEVEVLGEGRKRERKKVIREFKPKHAQEMYVLLKLCCYTGCDGKSGCLMTWDNIDLLRSTISYVREKTRKKTGGKVISLPIHPDLRAALLTAEAWHSDGDSYVLPNVAQRYLQNHTGVQRDVMKMIRCATGVETTMKDAKGKRKFAANAYSLHSFRHTFVSFCANAGVPLAIVAEIVGHGSPVMTRHYSHISDEAKAKAIKALPAMNGDGMDAEALRLAIAKVVNSAEIEKLARICDFIKAMS